MWKYLQIWQYLLYVIIQAAFFESNEIKIILSFLRTIDNPTKEISLISTMMSPIYGFTPDELAEIRIENKYKISIFLYQIQKCLKQ